MRKIVFLIFLLAATVVAPTGSFAQIKKPTGAMSAMGGMSEAQLFQLWRNATNTGMTESEVIKIFTQMGVNGAQ